jgi:hypothetical protein
MSSRLTDNMLLWLLGVVALLFHSLMKIVRSIPVQDSNRKYDIDRIPGPVCLPFIGTSWIYWWRYKKNKIHEAYEGNFECRLIHPYLIECLEEPS